MRIDLHAHVKLTKKSEFSLAYFRDSIREARDSGLDAIAVTEHFNTYRFYDLYEELDRHYEYQKDYYDIGGFKAFPGMEVDIADGGHILVIGPRSAVLELRGRLEPHVAKENFVAFERLLDWCDELSLLRIGAHPYRESNPLIQHGAALLGRLHALDLNGKDLYTYGRSNRNQVEELARGLGLPVVAGSDTHHPLQFGCVVNRLEVPCETAAELSGCLKEGRYAIEESPCLETKVKAATLVKKLLKKQGANAASLPGAGLGKED